MRIVLLDKKRTLFWILSLVLLVAGGISLARLLLPPSLPAAKVEPFYQGSTDGKAMALTFNVDWGEEYLPSILTTLKDNQVKATFYLSGKWAEKFPSLASQIAREGHEVGNHGYSHPHPDRISLQANLEEIRRAEEAIQQACNQKTTLFAPPYGERKDHVLQAADQAGYRTVLWTIDTIDWQEGRTKGDILYRVSQKAQNGAIVLMHPTQVTAEALPELLSRLKQEGYSLVTVSEVLPP